LLFSQSRHDVIGRARPAGQTDGGLARLLGRMLTGSGERRVRLRTLTMIRWIAITGQAFTVALVHFSLEVELPLGPLLGAIGLSALINLILSGFAATTRLTERSAGLLLGYDILQLAFLLGLTGGLQNPFSILLIVPVTLSASTLSLRTTVVLCLMVVMASTLLALFPTDLPWYYGTFQLPALYVGALWLALVLGTVLVAGYAWRVADEARRLSDALAATQMALAREQQLSALGGLAAAAAHELGSPLATIAVTARELANSMPHDSPLAEDVALLVSEAARSCARSATRARARSTRRSPACRSRTCSRPWPNPAGGDPRSTSSPPSSGRCRRARSRGWCRPRSSGTRWPI
jgi:two-component system sensor histidine kinase RegB